MIILFIILAVVLAIPFLGLFGLFHIASSGFENLGLSSGAVLALLLSMLIGSTMNIPIGRHRLVEIEESRFFGLVKKKQFTASGLSVNVGGAIIPLGLVLYLLPRAPVQETMLASVLLIVLSHILARFEPGKGIALPLVLPALFATVFALILAPDAAPIVAFISGVLGVIVGGDLLHLPRVMRDGQGVMSIGGAGVFDGIFLVAIIATFLAGFIG